MTFEETLQRLETIVAELEGDQVELARALALFEEGVQCLRSAAAQLAQADAKVRTLTEHTDGTFELTDRDG